MKRNRQNPGGYASLKDTCLLDATFSAGLPCCGTLHEWGEVPFKLATRCCGGTSFHCFCCCA